MHRFGVLVAGMILAFGLASSGQGATPPGTIVVGTTDKITELSPENSYDYWTWHVIQQTAEGLVDFRPGTTDIVPKLATSWQVSPDGRVYTFRLRRGVRFTDGEPFDAQSVKFTFDRALRLKGPEGAVGLISGIQRVEAVGPGTARILIKEADATFLSRLTSQVAISVILSPKTTPANAFARGRYAGTGPYRIAQYVPGQRLVLEAYPGYWGMRPRSQRVIEVFYANAQALASAVEAGQVDIAFRTFNPDDIRRLGQNPRLQVVRGPMPSVRYIVFNVRTPPFDDVRVRRAVAFAVDRDRIVRDVFAGINSPLYSMVPPGMWSHTPAFPRRNLDQAKRLLAEAGYNEQNKLQLTLWYTPTHYGDTEADVAAVLKSSLEETGIVSVTLRSSEWSDYTSAMAKGQLGMFLLGWFPDFVDPDNFLSPWLVEAPDGLGTYLHQARSATDRQYYERFRTLLGQAKRTTDRARRTEFYRQAQQMLAESAILVPLWQNQLQGIAVAQRNVRGIVLDLTTTFRTWLLSKGT